MKKSRKDKAITRRQTIAFYAFLLPWLVGFFVFTAYPFLNTIYMSFHQVAQKVEGVVMTYSGLENYDVALFRNPDFVPNLIDFGVMELAYTPTIVVISFIISLLLNREIKFRAGFRALFFLPVIVMSGPVMYQLMDTGSTTNAGIQDMALYRMVFSYSPMLADGLDFLFQNYSVILWFTGIPIVLFISGLQKINQSIVEAATIDSATSWQILWKITIPVIRPTALVVAIFTIVQLGLYSNNPVFDMIIESMANTQAGLGISATFAWIYSLVVLIVIGFAYLLLKEPKEVIAKVQKRRERKWSEL